MFIMLDRLQLSILVDTVLSFNFQEEVTQGEGS